MWGGGRVDRHNLPLAFATRVAEQREKEGEREEPLPGRIGPLTSGTLERKGHLFLTPWLPPPSFPPLFLPVITGRDFCGGWNTRSKEWMVKERRGEERRME